MSPKRHKYCLFIETGSPLQQVLENIKADPSTCFKDKVEDALLVLEYPYVLKRQGAKAEQVIFQAGVSIHRFNQKITALTALLNSMPVVPVTQSAELDEIGSSNSPFEKLKRESMSPERPKRYLFVENDSPLHQILESIKADPSTCFKEKVWDALLLMEYPYILNRQGAKTEQVIRQAEESIRRFKYEITALSALINSLSEGDLHRESAIASNGKSSQSESAIASNGQSSYFKDSFEEEEDEETSYHVLKAEDIF